jgi:hypothetical protein
MGLRPWRERVVEPLVGSDALSRIGNASALVQHFGHWPSFEDAELISLEFRRGNHMEASSTGDWDGRTPEALTATFYVFAAQADPESEERRPAHALLAFSDLRAVNIEGLNYQNPIQGLGVHVEQVAGFRSPFLRIDWGGTGFHHEVSILCGSMSVRGLRPIRSITSRS